MRSRSLFLFGLHMVIGLILTQYKALSLYWGISILVIGLADIYMSRNKNNEAGYWAAYYMSMEVFLRMTDGTLSWEFGKFGVLILLLAGIAFETRRLNFP